MGGSGVEEESEVGRDFTLSSIFPCAGPSRNKGFRFDIRV